MLDPDPPDGIRACASDEPDVAAGVEGVVPEARPSERIGGPVDRPALHEPRRIERAGRVGIEVAAGLPSQLLAPREHLLHLRRGVRDRELPACKPADLAVLLVGRERLVDGSKPVEDRVEGALVDIVVTNIDDDRHAHDLLDPADAERLDRDSHQAFFACRIAPCSDWANA